MGTKHGICRWCGTVGKRSATHVPMNKAGNSNPMRPAVEKTDGTVTTTELGRAKQGGIRGYWFCAECSRRTAAR
jgi:hypothetical protein